MEQSGIYAECYEDGIPYRFQRGNQANTFACVCRTFHAIACMDRSRGIALPDSCEESWMGTSKKQLIEYHHLQDVELTHISATIGKLEGMVDTHCYDWQFTYVTRNPDAPKSTASTTTSPEASGGNKPTPSVDQPSSTGEGQIQSISIEETDRPAASSESSEKASSDEGQELATTETELVPEESSGANASSTAPISSTTDATDNPTSIK